MQVVSCRSALYQFLFLFFLNATIFQSGKFVQLPTRSLDFSYTKHDDPHFHKVRRRNRLLCEYINIGLPSASLSVHASELSLSHDPF